MKFKLFEKTRIDWEEKKSDLELIVSHWFELWAQRVNVRAEMRPMIVVIVTVQSEAQGRYIGVVWLIKNALFDAQPNWLLTLTKKKTKKKLIITNNQRKVDDEVFIGLYRLSIVILRSHFKLLGFLLRIL